MILVCDVILQEHVTKESCNYQSGDIAVLVCRVILKTT